MRLVIFAGAILSLTASCQTSAEPRSTNSSGQSEQPLTQVALLQPAEEKQAADAPDPEAMQFSQEDAEAERAFAEELEHGDADTDRIWAYADLDVGDIIDVQDYALEGDALERDASSVEIKIDENGLYLDAAGDAPTKARTTVQVTADVPDATVYLDGIHAGRVGDEIDVAPGAVSLEISAPGYRTETLKLTLRQNEVKVHQINLEKAAH